MAPPSRQFFHNGTALRCTLCGLIKPTSAFSPRAGYGCGFQSRCRECFNAVQRAATTAEKTRARYVRQKERQAAYKRGWRERNPERHREAEHRRRAAKAGVQAEPVSALVLLERDDGVCGICGGDVDPLDFHVDHAVPLSRGGPHTYANTQVAHPGCNTGKRDRLPW